MRSYHGMQYKTRGDDSPQGRPKVYLCCAERDFDRLFESVSEEILSIQPNAAIWYADPQASREGDAFLADLNQMQLLVVPVTSAFLTEQDPARTVAFAHALAHHIPVLPLLQEPGLEDSFNEICGALECLSPFADRSDPTAVPYEEKIRRFLQAVLVSDELAGRVRAAFDAYIFLSYRKKDRAAAQKIMRLIHDNAFCRDIAIWYDEFLTPGENFNQAIAEAMEKSALFALVVTPSLLEEPNYVLTTEYPAARRLRKPILPLEAEDTELAELQRLYDGIAQKERTDEPEAVTARLRALLSDLALRQRSDPTHTFLMGIAYLSGVDVEVNHARAVPLITEAAEAGLPEALEKLVSMYQTGEGVERDYRAAVRWQQKLVAARRAEAGDAPDDAALEACVRATEDLGRYQLDVAYPQYALETYRALLTLLDAMDARQHPKAREHRALCFRGLGSACSGLGRAQEALDWYHKSLELSRLLAREQDSAEHRRQLAEDEHMLGGMCRSLGRSKEALQWFEAEIAHRQALAADGGAEDRRALSAAYDKAAGACRALRDFTAARQWDEKNRSLSEALTREFGETQDRRMLSDSCSGLARDFEWLNRPDTAREWYEKSLSLRQALAQETGTLEDRRMLISALDDIGCFWLGGGNDPEQGLHRLREAVRLCDSLTRKTGTLQMRELLARTNFHLYDACERLGLARSAEAADAESTAANLYEHLAKTPGAVSARRGRALLAEREGRRSEDLALDIIRTTPEIPYGTYPAAKSAYLDAYSNFEALARETDEPQEQHLLRLSMRLSRVCLRLDQPEESEQWYEKAVSLLQQEQPLSRSGRAAEYFGSLGEIHEEKQQLAKAETRFTQAVEILRALMRESDDERIVRKAVVWLASLGSVCCRLGRTDDAARRYRESIGLMESLVRKNSTPQNRYSLCELRRAAGLFFQKSGRMQTAETQFRKALEIIEPLAREGGSTHYRESLWRTELNLFGCTNLETAERLRFLDCIEADALQLDEREQKLRDMLLRTVKQYRASLNAE